ncbi:MAG: VOC family protein [Candidatus Omnitrophica bacterium]|nr:VOC family protein [Candidatus Omnitrophota bacterium]MDD5652674.1 VOC family protein [Candidatus Omnitrophota bacterium]
MQGIRHTGIVVRDLKREVYFYQRLLGLKIARSNDEQPDYVKKILNIRNGRLKTIKLQAKDGNLIELLYFSGYRRSGRRHALYLPGYTHVSFTVKDIDKQYERLKKAGIKFLSKPQLAPHGYAKLAFCFDYEGNAIELVEELSK